MEKDGVGVKSNNRAILSPMLPHRGSLNLEFYQSLGKKKREREKEKRREIVGKGKGREGRIYA